MMKSRSLHEHLQMLVDSGDRIDAQPLDSETGKELTQDLKQAIVGIENLTLAEKDDGLAAGAAGSTDSIMTRLTRSVTIGLVSDSRQFTKVLRRGIQEMGHTLRAGSKVGDVASCSEELEAKRPPDIMILDGCGIDPSESLAETRQTLPEAGIVCLRSRFDDPIHSLDGVEILKIPFRHVELTRALDRFGDSAHRVYIVDDNREFRDFLVALLSGMQLPLDLHLAESGDSMLDLIKARVPDVVITDLMMPGMNGFDLCKQIRLRFPSARIGIIALTGATSEKALQRLRAAGADEVLEKPHGIRHLESILRRLLRRPEVSGS